MIKDKFCFVYVTVENFEQAELIAELAIKEKLIACLLAMTFDLEIAALLRFSLTSLQNVSSLQPWVTSGHT